MKKLLLMLILVSLCACTAQKNTQAKATQMNEKNAMQNPFTLDMCKVAVKIEKWEDEEEWFAEWYAENGHIVGLSSRAKYNEDRSYIDYSEADEIMRTQAQAATVVYETTEQSKIILQQIEAAHGANNVEGAVNFRAWEDEENWYAEFYNESGMQLAVGCYMKQ